MKVWRIESQQLLKNYKHEGAVYSVDISFDNRLIATGGLEMPIKIWDFSDINSDTPFCELEETDESITQKLQFSHNAKYLISANNND